MKHCMYCGTLMNNDAIYCPKCGKKQNKDNNQNFNKTPNPVYQSSVPKRGTAPMVWGWLFIAGSFFLPILANIISIILGFYIKKYPERKTIGITIVIIATVLAFIFNFSGYAFGFWKVVCPSLF